VKFARLSASDRDLPMQVPDFYGEIWKLPLEKLIIQFK